jgi:branched-subunit amino acid aminotransferase/4-amino-4-deoxychorismate lyase
LRDVQLKPRFFFPNIVFDQRAGVAGRDHPRQNRYHRYKRPLAMSVPLAYLNGEFLPEADARLPFYDSGFVMGTTVTEQLRTFAGSLFQLDVHLARLFQGLETIGVPSPLSEAEMSQRAEELVAANKQLVKAGDDLGLCIFITPGPYHTMAPQGPIKPTIGMHTYLLPFHLWETQYTEGVRLVVSDVQEVSANCWPRQLKCRSRMHYHLADQEVQRRFPGARPLLLDEEGFVTETPTAGLICYFQTAGLIAPPTSKTLASTSWHYIRALAESEGIEVLERNLTPQDVASATEVMLASTPYCLLPVVEFQNCPVGSGKPGPMFSRLISMWGTRASVDIRAQAAGYRDRPRP